MMPKTKSWREIRATRSKLTPAQREAVDRRAKAESARLMSVTKLDQLRRARNLSQEQLADQLGTNQGAVSRLERQSDLYLSTLQRFVHAMGGRLHIQAQFTDAEPIELDLFADLESPATKKRNLTHA